MNGLTLPIRNLLSQPVRTSLTTLGVAVAVAGFISLTGLTQGVEHSFSAGLGEPGVDIIVSARDSFNLFSGSIPQGVAAQLAKVEGVAAASPVLVNVTSADDNASIVVAGWPDGSPLWQGVTLLGGRIPQPGKWEVVLGNVIADGLGKKVGDTISLVDQPYTVVGIGSFTTALNQNIALVPLPGLQELLGREDTVTLIEVQLARPLDPARDAAAKAELTRVAARYQVSDTDQFTSNIRFFRLIQAIGSTVSLVVLVMATIAIANTLLMSVNERTFEIGILSALGWPPPRILRLILAEGTVISVVGGVIGIGLGVLTMDLVSRAEVAAGLMESYITPGIVVEALIAVFVAGPVGALYPAWRAIRLVPAEALRRN
ncbi:MAG TPA: ABC transporter permease [Bauldia sp.]|nr:ABC transporter permease [Bauldia sp.]